MKDDDPCVCGRDDCPLESNDPVVVDINLFVQIRHGYGDLLSPGELARQVQTILDDCLWEGLIENMGDPEAQERAWDRHTPLSTERLRVYLR